MKVTPKILVVGDSCEDVFVYGHAQRLCPDAPVPVFVEERRKVSGGMAKNVYANLCGLKNGPRVRGRDYPAVQLALVTNGNEVTKTRYVDGRTNQMLLRVDSGEEHIQRLDVHRDLPNLREYDVVVVSDYDKGLLTEHDLEWILSEARVSFLDTKKLLRDWHRAATFVKINHVEFDRTRHLLTPDEQAALIVTRGAGGCSYRSATYPVPSVDVRDTCGAGDTFLAALAFDFAFGRDIDGAIRFANDMATEAVQHRGVYVPHSEA